jgi:hypothetical protein
MSGPSPLRYLAVVLKPRREVLIAFAALTALTVWLGATNPADMEQTIAYALLFQMFAAATGYRDVAVRGHLDPILTIGWRRSKVAAAHWLVSMRPGCVAWFVMTAIVWIARPHEMPRSATAAGLVAFVYVSSVVWALTLPFPRYVTGVIWLLLIVLLAGSGHIESFRHEYVAGAEAWSDTFVRTAAVLVVPVLLIARPDAADAALSLLVLLAAAIAVIGGAAYISGSDVPLQNPS